LGALFFGVVLVAAVIEYAKPDAGSTTVFGIGGVAVIGLTSILVGVPLMALVYRGCRDYFDGRTLPKGSVAPGGETIEAVQASR
jgi:hypothetical protein